MAEEKLLTIRDVSLLLGISEKEVMDLAESGVIPAYKIGGLYLRFRKEQVEQFKKTHKISSRHKPKVPLDYSLNDRLSDFFYFNDFYIVSILLIVLILLIIFRG